MDQVPVGILLNDASQQLGTLSWLLQNAAWVRVAMGFVRTSGLALLQGPLERLVRERRIFVLSSNGPTQLSAEVVSWFELRGGGDLIRVLDHRPRTFHAKTWLIDSTDGTQTHFIVGSGNLSRSGLMMNVEAGLWTPCPPNAALILQARQWFDGLWCHAPVANRASFASERQLGDDEWSSPIPITWSGNQPPSPIPLLRPDHEVGSTPTTSPVRPAPLFPRASTTSTETTPSALASRAPSSAGTNARTPQQPLPVGTPCYEDMGWRRSPDSTSDAPRVFSMVGSNESPIPLAPFQREAVEALRQHRRTFADHRPAVLSLATGGGKTKTAVWWLLEDFVTQGQRVLWMAHRRELLDQVTRTIEEHFPLMGNRRRPSITRIDGESKDAAGDIVVASVQSLVRDPTLVMRGKAFPFACVCFDEAHHATADGTSAMLQTLLRASRASFLLGLTATPYRSDGDEELFLRQLFCAKIAYRRSFGELVALGFLAEPTWEFLERVANRLRLAPHEISEIQRRDDFSQEMLSRVAEDDDWNESILDRWCSRRSQYGSTLVFASTTDHAKTLAQGFRQRGVLAEAIDYKLDLETRSETLQAFADGKLEVLVNVAILTEGTDITCVRTVLIARPTLSSVLYRQMIGRAARKGPHGDKTRFTVLDCVNSALFHDLDDLHHVTEEVQREFRW